MFPLADPKGHVLGFGARAIRPDDQPKYLNTSESELFHKGSLVYGADLARAAAARSGRLVLVEGYTDVIALRQAGIPETVCSMGTALTDRQLDALKRLTPKVLLCQDPDAAGQDAVAKGKDAIRVFNEGHHLRGFDLRVVRLPPGQDPADVVQREGAEAMRALLETSVPVPRFEVDRALDAADLGTPEGRDDALRLVAPVVSRLDPGPLQYDLIQRIANRLQMPESLTQEALRSVPRENGRDRGSLPPAPAGARRDVERPARRHGARVPRALPRRRQAGPARAGGDGHRRDVLGRADAARRPLPRRAPRASGPVAARRRTRRSPSSSRSS